MSGWILILAVIVIVAVVAYAMRSRSTTVAGSEAETPARDYRGERESSRLSDMSDEDRAWEAASRERSRNAQQADPPSSNDG